MRPEKSRLAVEIQPSPCLDVDAAKQVRARGPAAGVERVGQHCEIREIHEIAALMQLVPERPTGRPDVWGNGGGNPRVRADFAPRRRKRELDPIAEIQLAKRRRLVNGQPIVVDEIPVLGIGGRPVELEPGNRAEASFNRHVDVDGNRRTVEVLFVDREQIGDRREVVASRARKRPTRPNRHGAFGLAEQEIGRRSVLSVGCRRRQPEEQESQNERAAHRTSKLEVQGAHRNKQVRHQRYPLEKSQDFQ